MRKVYAISAIVFVIIAIILGSNFVNNKSELNINIEKLAEDLKKLGIFTDQLSIIDKEVVIQKYDLSSARIKNICSYAGTGATSEEILIIELNDSKYNEEVKDLIEEKLKDVKENFSNYVPEEVPKIENKNLKIKGKYVILCISEEPEKARKVINEYIR